MWREKKITRKVSYSVLRLNHAPPSLPSHTLIQCPNHLVSPLDGKVVSLVVNVLRCMHVNRLVLPLDIKFASPLYVKVKTKAHIVTTSTLITGCPTPHLHIAGKIVGHI